MNRNYKKSGFRINGKLFKGPWSRIMYMDYDYIEQNKTRFALVGILIVVGLSFFIYKIEYPRFPDFNRFLTMDLFFPLPTIATLLIGGALGIIIVLLTYPHDKRPLTISRLIGYLIYSLVFAYVLLWLLLFVLWLIWSVII